MSAAVQYNLAELAELDARITADRGEAKYLLTANAARLVVAELDRRLDRHRHRAGETPLLRANHFVTTIYFDTAARSLFHRAIVSSEYNVKLRAKEYYDVHPDAVEETTELTRFESVLWLELKYRDGAKTRKRRIGIPKLDLPRFFVNGTITADMLTIQGPAYGSDARHVLTEVAELCMSCGPMRADCLVNYQRQAWQDAGAQLRVTLDSGLTSFAPPADLWDRNGALLRQTLGAPVATETRNVLEVKSHGQAPWWLTSLLEEHRIEPVSFSKFEAASSAVHV